MFNRAILLRNLVIPNVDEKSDMENESQINHFESPKRPMVFGESPLTSPSNVARYPIRKKDK